VTPSALLEELLELDVYELEPAPLSAAPPSAGASVLALVSAEVVEASADPPSLVPSAAPSFATSFGASTASSVFVVLVEVVVVVYVEGASTSLVVVTIPDETLASLTTFLMQFFPFQVDPSGQAIHLPLYEKNPSSHCRVTLVTDVLDESVEALALEESVVAFVLEESAVAF